MEINIKLPKPHPGQQKVLDSKAKFKILMCGRRFGKSLICHIIAIQHMLDGKHVAFVVPTHEGCREVFRQIRAYLPAEVIEIENHTDRKIVLVTGGTLKFYSGEALSQFRGNRYHLCICDEASFCFDLKRAWPEDILPTLIDYDGCGILISTPYGRGGFFDSMFQKGKDAVPGFESFHFTTMDNPTIPASFLETIRAEMTDAQWNQEILAIPGENSACPFTMEAVTKNIITELSQEPTVVYGIDISTGHGSDFTTVIGLDINGRVTHCERWKLPLPVTKKKLKQLPGNVPKYQDSNGVGEGLAQELAMEMENYYGFSITTQSKLRMIIQLINAVQKGEVKYPEVVADEMSVFEYKRNQNTGHTSYNARSGFNDDLICALAIALHHKDLAVSNSTWKLYSC